MGTLLLSSARRVLLQGPMELFRRGCCTLAKAVEALSRHCDVALPWGLAAWPVPRQP
jgi:hypothetical protein